MISQETKDRLHERLVQERVRVQEETNRLGGGVDGRVFQEDETDAIDEHSADAGSELFERGKNVAVLANSEASLRQIDAALKKYDEGTYGVCDNCGKPVGEKRLEALPEATLCIGCQALAEHDLRN